MTRLALWPYPPDEATAFEMWRRDNGYEDIADENDIGKFNMRRLTVATYAFRAAYEAAAAEGFMQIQLQRHG